VHTVRLEREPQAYVSDVKAGTCHQDLEAADNCPVSVIHPDTPWNPDERGVEELLERRTNDR